MHGRARTLRARLAVTQAVCGAAVLVLAIGVQVAQALRYGDGDLDRGMRFYARAVAAPLDRPEVASAMPHDDLADVDALAAEANGLDGRRLAFQVLSLRGALLHRSAFAPAAPFAALRPGFHDIAASGDTWRVHVSEVDAAGLLVVVAERRGDRWRSAAHIAWRVTLPLLPLLPLMLAGSWLAARHAVRPLRRAVASIAGRRAGDLRPLAPGAEVAEIQPLLDEISKLLQRVAHARSAERSFFAEAAHEIKTPLAVVATQAHLLSTAASGAERRLALHDLERALQRTSHLVSQLLALAAVEGRVAPEAALDLAELVADRLALLAPQAHAAGVELMLQAPARAPLQARADELVSLIDNLVDNAIRYNRPGGKVEVTLAVDTDGLLLQVSDSGRGIAADERPRVFERFHRAPGSPGTGSGLGLAIVRRVVERLDGRVWIEDAPAHLARDGPGVCLLVRLPARREDSVAAATEAVR